MSTHTDPVQAAAQAARWALQVLGLVERGHANRALLARVVDKRVLDELGSMRPLAPGVPVHGVRVAGPLVRVTGDGLHAYAAAAARRPDGQMTGYVLELDRVSALRGWRVSQLTSVQDRRILPPAAPREYGQHLPQDLDGLLAAAARARDAAAGELAAVQDRLAQVRAALEHAPRRSAERRRLEAERQAANREVERRQARLEEAKAELAAYQEAQHDRRLAADIAGRDPLAGVTKDRQHLAGLLGPEPAGYDRLSWQAAADAINGYRRRWTVTDRDSALGGDLPADAPQAQVAHRRAVLAAVARYRARREPPTRDPEGAREPGRDRSRPAPSRRLNPSLPQPGKELDRDGAGRGDEPELDVDFGP